MDALAGLARRHDLEECLTVAFVGNAPVNINQQFLAFVAHNDRGCAGIFEGGNVIGCEPMPQAIVRVGDIGTDEGSGLGLSILAACHGPLHGP